MSQQNMKLLKKGTNLEETQIDKIAVGLVEAARAKRIKKIIWWYGCVGEGESKNKNEG